MKNLKTINPNTLTKNQLNTMNKNIVKKGVHICSNGEKFQYKVTELDVLNREFTGLNVLPKLMDGTIHYEEIHFLITEIYGEYPNNNLLNKHFNIINN